MIRVGVIGAYGKMGREVCRAIVEDPDCVLVAAVDSTGCGENVGAILGHPELTLPISDELDALNDAEVDVAIDFTHPDAVMDNLRWCVRHAVHVVVGTTGISQANLDEIRGLIEEEGQESNVFVAPNFAIGAVLMMRFAAAGSKFLPDVEIIELHHSKKADAPSGTALKTAEEISKARAEGAVGSRVEGGRDGSARRRRRRDPGALGAAAGPRRPPRGDPGRPRPVADDPPRLLRPGVVHARRSARREVDREASRA